MTGRFLLGRSRYSMLEDDDVSHRNIMGAHVNCSVFSPKKNCLVFSFNVLS
jgi:hypothetical protein